MNDENILRKPAWLKIKLPSGKEYLNVKEIVQQNKLHTICESGKCPNIGECWGAGTATFMILGDICTRSCKFCAVKTGKPLKVNSDEPNQIVESIKLMNLKHCVLTSVDRDDLEDGGSEIWAKTIQLIHKECPDTTIEALIPDFKGNKIHLKILADSKPDIVSHNLETVRRITKEVRSVATYEKSLDVLRFLKICGMITKSGVMVGLGETDDEIYSMMDDLVEVDCDIFTIGQYLQPTKSHLTVKRYVSTEQFFLYKKIGLDKGLKIVESAPLVRSSYHAEKHLNTE